MQRPTSVTVFGVLNIIFGSLGILCTPLSMVTLFSPGASQNPVLKIMQDNPVFRIWMITAAILGVIAAIVLLAAGIGLLRLRPWARTLSIGYGVYAIVAGLIGMVFNVIYVILPLLSQPGHQAPFAAGAIGGVIGGCVGLAYPVLLIIFMTRPHIRLAFANADTVTPLPPAQ